MTFSEKLLRLRRQAGLSQEELAEQLQVSRQAVSRWELGTALPDAPNLLALSRLFAVSTDYLLRDEWESDRSAEKPRSAQAELSEQQKETNRQTALVVLYTISALAALLGLMGYWVLQRLSVVLAALMLHVVAVGSFEAGFRKQGIPDANALRYRRKFYRGFIWLAALFPILALVRIFAWLVLPFPHGVLHEVLLGGGLYLLLCLGVRWHFREPNK